MIRIIPLIDISREGEETGVIIYTDASPEPGIAVAIIDAPILDFWDRENGVGRAFDRLVALSVTDAVLKYLHDTSVIYALELLPHVLTLFE